MPRGTRTDAYFEDIAARRNKPNAVTPIPRAGRERSRQQGAEMLDRLSGISLFRDLFAGQDVMSALGNQMSGTLDATGTALGAIGSQVGPAISGTAEAAGNIVGDIFSGLRNNPVVDALVGPDTPPRPASPTNPTVPPGPEAVGQSAFAPIREEFEAQASRLAAVELAQKNPDLTPEEWAVLREEREKLRQEIRDTERAMDARLRQFNTLSAITGVQNDPNYDLAKHEILSLDEVQGAEIGITEEFLDEIMENRGDPALVDRMLAQESMKQQLLIDINDMVQNKNDAEQLLASYDADKLAAERQAQFPAVEWSIDPSPEGVAMTYFGYGLDNINLDHLNEEQVSALVQASLALSSFEEDDPMFEAQIQALAQTFQLDPQEYADALQVAYANLDRAHEQVTTALDQTQFNPADITLQAAIYQTLTSRGIPAELADYYARNAYLQKLIFQKSGGSIFSEKGGSQKGLGGLSEQFYDATVGGWENVKESAEDQIWALFLYIDSQHQGSVEQAYEYFLESNEWG